MLRGLKLLLRVAFRICFFLLGEGEGGVQSARKGGSVFLLENPRRGVLPGGGGTEGPGQCLRGIWKGGGGPKYFFRG